jgi:hypothetical protein
VQDISERVSIALDDAKESSDEEGEEIEGAEGVVMDEDEEDMGEGMDSDLDD